MKFEIVTVLNMNIMVVCVVTPVSWIGGVQRFGGTYWLHTRKMAIVCSCEPIRRDGIRTRIPQYESFVSACDTLFTPGVGVGLVSPLRGRSADYLNLCQPYLCARGHRVRSV
jgi:hypothetical protein